MQEIYALITAVGHLSNVAKTVFQAHSKIETDAASIELSQAVIELQGKISALQVSYQTLWESNEELKKQVAAFDKWEQEKADYELKHLGNGAYAYSLKNCDPKNQHGLCTNCWEDRRKSILQNTEVGNLICPKCQNIVVVNGTGPASYYSTL